MASAAVELLGFLLALLGALGTLVVTLLPQWRTSAHVGSSVVTAVTVARGLWMECVFQSTGSFQCESYTSLLALPTDLQACRALMALALALAALGVAAAPLGMRCTVCLGEGAGELKARAAGMAGGLFAAGGFLALVPVAWTAHEVVQSFHQPGLPAGVRYELGECLYGGLAFALLSMLGGALLAASCCGNGGGGYPYPGGAGLGPGNLRPTSHTYRSAALPTAASRGHAGVTHAASGSSPGSTQPTHGRKAAGYDVMGYV